MYFSYPLVYYRVTEIEECRHSLCFLAAWINYQGFVKFLFFSATKIEFTVVVKAHTYSIATVYKLLKADFFTHLPKF